MNNTLSSFRDSSQDEKIMRLKILSMPYKQRNLLTKFIDDLNDSLKICDDHCEPYIFFDSNQFYCRRCIPPNTTGLQLIDNGVQNNEQIQVLNNSLRAQYNQQIQQQQDKLLQINQETIAQRRQKIQNQIQQQELGNQDNIANQVGDLFEILQKRDRFIQIQQFISHIPLDIRNRSQHEELHSNNLQDLDNIVANIGQHNQQTIPVDNLIRYFLTG